MNRYQSTSFTGIVWLVLCLFTLSGCNNGASVIEAVEPVMTAKESNTTPDKATVNPTETHIIQMDASSYFGKLNGAAVFYDASKEQYLVYNEALAREQRSPCSTFKIISSLVALEHTVITADDSTRTWSGEVFWNADWNQDMTFSEAFRSSCVWYYRALIDEIGPDIMQTEVNRLQYGNCDLSDWEGRLNTNNHTRALTGFWIESSLKISAIEQVQVMERIFAASSVYTRSSIEALKQVMLVTDSDVTTHAIYGKTGMGKAAGIVVDAWFTGFVETAEGTIYFCVYLGESNEAAVSSAKAKEIAIQIAADHWGSAL